MNNLAEEIEIPSGISASIENNELILSKDGKKVRRKMISPIEAKIDGNKIIVSSKKSGKKEKKVFGSMKAHIRNMILGLNEGFIYKLQAVSVHFPITLKIENNQLHVKNFLGEKKDRVIELVDGVEVNINKDIIELESADIEKAGSVAANIEKGTKVRKRDRRIFQDGIFITEKPGRK